MDALHKDPGVDGVDINHIPNLTPTRIPSSMGMVWEADMGRGSYWGFPGEIPNDMRGFFCVTGVR